MVRLHDTPRPEPGDIAKFTPTRRVLGIGDAQTTGGTSVHTPVIWSQVTSLPRVNVGTGLCEKVPPRFTTAITRSDCVSLEQLTSCALNVTVVIPPSPSPC